MGQRMINARSETLLEKPSFRQAVQKRRCLIPANGFYEWRREAKRKIPMWIQFKTREPFAFPGLWDCWIDRDTGKPLYSFTIITTHANALLRPIHDRMPVMYRKDMICIRCAGVPVEIRYAARAIMVLVLPVPAPARIRACCRVRHAAFRWLGLSSDKRVYIDIRWPYLGAVGNIPLANKCNGLRIFNYRQSFKRCPTLRLSSKSQTQISVRRIHIFSYIRRGPTGEIVE